jgi:hypothetical protein
VAGAGVQREVEQPGGGACELAADRVTFGGGVRDDIADELAKLAGDGGDDEHDVDAAAFFRREAEV